MNLALGLIAVLLLAPPETPTALSRAEQASEQLEFDVAALAYQEALKGPGSREERIRTYRGLGLALAFMGRSREATRAFQVLLLLDPTASVPANLGPKIARPFKEARRLTQDRPQRIYLERDRYSGEVVAELAAPDLPITQLTVVAREEGREFERSRSIPPTELLVGVPMDPAVAVEAYAYAEDEGGGVLLELGAPQRRQRFAAVAEPPPAVASAQVEADRQRRQELESDESSAGSRWPWILGAAGVVGAGVIAGLVVTQRGGAAPSLPSADRQGQLP